MLAAHTVIDGVEKLVSRGELADADEFFIGNVVNINAVVTVATEDSGFGLGAAAESIKIGLFFELGHGGVKNQRAFVGEI